MIDDVVVEVYRSPVKPDEDKFRCNACKGEFKRYDTTIKLLPKPKLRP